jgi:hypothetical protein
VERLYRSRAACQAIRYLVWRDRLIEDGLSEEDIAHVALRVLGMPSRGSQVAVLVWRVNVVAEAARRLRQDDGVTQHWWRRYRDRVLALPDRQDPRVARVREWVRGYVPRIRITR